MVLHYFQQDLHLTSFCPFFLFFYCCRPEFPFFISASSLSQDLCYGSPCSSMYRFVILPLVLLVSFCVRFSHNKLFEWVVLYLILFQSLVAWFFIFLLRTMPPKGPRSKALIKGSFSRTSKGARDENLPINPPVQPPSIPKGSCKNFY